MVRRQPKYFDDTLSTDDRIDDLMKQLTLKEKLKLLSGHRFSFWFTKPIRRLKIKPLGMTDGPIGVAAHSSYRRNTKFPCSKNLSSTWNRKLAYDYGVAVAKETRAVGRHVVLGPGINIDRTPLNGRTFEYFSEDPYLTKEMAIPFVKGVQSQRIGACVKHYAANNQETNRFHVNAVIDERTLNEIYLKAYKDVVEEADPWVFMSCYNKVNGIFGCEHKGLLRDSLMDKWGFKGYVVTDWWATRRVAKPEKSILAGLSLEMPIIKIYKLRLLKKALDEGRITIEDIDYLVKRLIRVMFLVGLFDKPEKIPKGERNTPQHQALAKEVAEESIVLLKNEKKILPLDIKKTKTIAVLGPNAKKKLSGFLYGGAASVVPKYVITPLQGLKEKCAGKIQFTSDVEAADVCILFLGLNHARGNDCESLDRTRLELSEDQIELVKDTMKKNPHTVVVLLNGSPVAMSDWIDSVPAVVEAWYPGSESGRAIANVLFGDVNPSGKLPITFPKKLSDSPAHKSKKTYPGDENVYYEEGIFVGYRHFDKEKIDPLFPFGFGLSYTTFEYNNGKINKESMTAKDKITFSVDITNTGKREGSEVVQLYVKDDKSTVERPEKELRNFEKINLKPGEKKTVIFEITTNDLEFYDVENHSWKHEKGKFTLMVGSSSRNIHYKQKIELK
ncbi:MAG: glycosyl hydrolase [Asgard group archaeon]|nr:glycosyl hydrolase [Asgard group archaeon]